MISTNKEYTVLKGKDRAIEYGDFQIMKQKNKISLAIKNLIKIRRYKDNGLAQVKATSIVD